MHSFSKDKARFSSVTVIGAGIVGCATAYELAARGLEVIVLEKGPRISEGVTSRNSGVIHSGIYYPPGSLKAMSCIRGKELLYEWCAKNEVPHRRTGKWIIGSREEEKDLYAIYQNATTSGATGLSWRSPREWQAELSGVRAEIGMFSADTGIVDPYLYSRSYRVRAEESGAEFVMNAEVQGAERRSQGGYSLKTSRGPIESDAVVNCAGLAADEVAAMFGVLKYRIYPWRGDYFRFRSPRKFERLIYPVKPKGTASLGVHLTIGLDGTYRLGPDAQAISSKSDFADPSEEALPAKRRAFVTAAARFLEGIDETQLTYDSCGIRPKLRDPGDPDERDFVLSEDLPGLINLVGIESPGLTAAADLAQRVCERF